MHVEKPGWGDSLHKTVLFFISIGRDSFAEQLDGIYRHFRGLDWHVQVVEQGLHRSQVRDALDFWKPVGAFVEYGDGETTVDQALFGDMPVVQFDIGRRKLGKGVYVGLDSRAVGKMGAEHLLKLGLAHYAYVGFPKPVPWDSEREAGFSEVIRSAGCEVETFPQNGGRGPLTRGERLVRWLKALPKPCGILCANDRVGEEVMNLCMALSIDVPRDVAVLGVDNDRQLCENQSPPMSSIVPDVSQGGRIAAEILERLIRRGRSPGEDSIVRRFLPARVEVRASTRRLTCDRAKVAVALEAIRTRACAGMNVSDVVEVMNLSRRAAENNFRMATGRSIHEEIDEIRFAHVFDLLRNSRQAIAPLCDLCGFSSQVALRKAFRKRTGMSMRDWRLQNASAQK